MFWDDWELEWDVVGLSIGIWALVGLMLFRGLMFGEALDKITLLGLPSRVCITIMWIIALPAGYFWAVWMLGRSGD